VRGDRDGSARRQPRNAIGWLFLAAAACLFLSTDGGGYAILTYPLGHHLPLGPLGLVLGQLRGPGLVLLFVVILLFPDGRLPSRFWRATLWVFGAVYAVQRWQRPWRSLLASQRRALGPGASPRIGVDEPTRLTMTSVDSAAAVTHGRAQHHQSSSGQALRRAARAGEGITPVSEAAIAPGTGVPGVVGGGQLLTCCLPRPGAR